MNEPGAALDRLRNNLLPLAAVEHAEERLQAAYPTARLGAVLALFYARDGEPHLVLTRRTAKLRTHSGQISLPGGRIDPSDCSAAEAALRETREELGIATAEVELWGALEPVFTLASNFVLLPFVGATPAAPDFAPNFHEVAEVIELPWRHLLRADSPRDEVWQLRGQSRKVGFYRYRDYRIWGATGRVLRYLVARAGGPEPPTGLVPPGEVWPDVPPAERGL